MTVLEDECEAAGLDPKAVARLARSLMSVAKDAERLGLTIFGGTGSGSLRFDDGGEGRLVVARIDEGRWDGGDGGCREDFAGLLRGEER